MNNIGWQPEEYLRRLQSHLTWARVRLKLHTLIANARRDPEIDEALEAARFFFFMAEEAFYLDAALTVCKLFDQREEAGLVKFLNKSLQDRKKIDYGGKGLRVPDLQAHLSTMTGFEDELETLKSLRDGWLAHHDRRAFEDPTTFVDEYYVRPDELKNMVDAAQEILVEHYAAFGMDFSPGVPREDDLLSVIDLLMRHRKTCQRRVEDPSDLEGAVRLMVHHEHSHVDALRSKLHGEREDS